MSDVQKWEVPAEVQEQFRKLDAELVQLTLQLGRLEATYVAQKNAILLEMEKRSKGRVEVVTEAAKAAGLDMDQKWTLDIGSMALTKSALA